jgi:hypothetical protein
MGTPTRSPGVCLHQSRYGNSADPARRVMMERTFHSVLGGPAQKLWKWTSWIRGRRTIDGPAGCPPTKKITHAHTVIHTYIGRDTAI